LAASPFAHNIRHAMPCSQRSQYSGNNNNNNDNEDNILTAHNEKIQKEKQNPPQRLP
jgi:hypothetical protein